MGLTLESRIGFNSDPYKELLKPSVLMTHSYDFSMEEGLLRRESPTLVFEREALQRVKEKIVGFTNDGEDANLIKGDDEILFLARNGDIELLTGGSLQDGWVNFRIVNYYPKPELVPYMEEGEAFLPEAVRYLLGEMLVREEFHVESHRVSGITMDIVPFLTLDLLLDGAEKVEFQSSAAA